MSHVREIAREAVVNSHGSDSEAEIIAEEVGNYIDSSWALLRLDGLARDQESWHRYITRQALNRYLSRLKEEKRRRGSQVREVDSQVSRWVFPEILNLAELAELSSEDLSVIRHIYLYGFSVKEASLIFDVSLEELVRRVRSAWQAMRRSIRDTNGDALEFAEVLRSMFEDLSALAL